jgi:GT2 family glycosyltransferase/ADP-heptose:LPS heptosyltransferase
VGSSGVAQAREPIKRRPPRRHHIDGMAGAGDIQAAVKILHTGGRGVALPPDPAHAAAPATEVTIMHIEAPGAEATVQAGAMILGRGWVVSDAEIACVRLYLDGRFRGYAAYGAPRPDIFERFPTYGQAAQSGINFAISATGLAGPAAELSVVVRTSSGRETRRLVKLRIAGLACAEDRRDKSGGNWPVRLAVERARIDADLTLHVHGWVAGAMPVWQLRLFLGDVALRAPDRGLARPDIAARHPEYLHAGLSGFRLVQTLDAATAARGPLLVEALCDGGARRRVTRPLDRASRNDPADIFFDIDQPVLAGGAARDPVRGPLMIGGWAVAPAGIDFIDVSIDERVVGRAFHFIRRPDVAASFPDRPESLLSGFALHVPARDIADGAHTVSVTVQDRDGARAMRSFLAYADRQGDAPAHETIRKSVGADETDHAMATLDRLGHRFFTVHVCLADLSAETIRRARDTLGALRAQAYPNWRVELHAPRATRVLASLAADAASPISARADLAENQATHFICRLRAGDRLGPDALLEFALHAAGHPADDFIYADDRRRDPAEGGDAAFFKPDWSPDLLLALNYIGRCWCARAGLAEADFIRSGDHACVLELTQSARAVGHVPRLLLDASRTAGCDDTAETAVASALARRGIAGTVAPGRAPGTFEVRRHVTQAGRVSAIIPTIAARGLIRTTIEGLREKTDWPDIEIICIDNIPAGQDLHWKRWLRQHADRVIEIAEPFNWSRLNNAGAAAATGAYLLFLNDDIEMVQPGWLRVLVSHAQRPEVAAVGPLLLYPDGTVQQAGMFGTGRGARHAFRFAAGDAPGPFGLALCERNVLAVTGACMAMRRDAFDAAGGFNETHGVVNNDVDYCLRAHSAGRRILFTPHARLIHHELASRAELTDSFDSVSFDRDWGRILALGDPFFNPNLSPESDLWQPESEPVQIAHAAQPRAAGAQVRRILALVLGDGRDFLDALRALRRLKQRFPAACVHVVVGPQAAPLAAGEACIDEVMQFDATLLAPRTERVVAQRSLDLLAARLVPHRFDIAIDLCWRPDLRHVLRHTGAPILAGLEQDGLFAWLDIAVQPEADINLLRKRVHVADELTRLVEAVSLACEPPACRVPGRDIAAARSHLAALPAFAGVPPAFFAARLVCVHPGAAPGLFAWPAAHFATLVALLAGVPGTLVLYIGTETIDSMAGIDGVMPLADAVRPADLALVLRACSLFVGGAGGPAHLAASLGVPTVAVHDAVRDASACAAVGPNAVALQRRMHCGPCYIQAESECPRAMACLTGLPPGQVYRACLRLLEQEGLLF